MIGMIHKRYSVYLLLLVIILNIQTNLVRTTNESVRIAATQQTNIFISINNSLEIFSNTRYISAGDTVNITFAVYQSNFTLVPNIQVTFTFDSSTFYRYSKNQMSSFLITINKTYTEITLQGQIAGDQKEIVFYGSSQQPVCLYSCIDLNITTTQLQVYQDIQTYYLMNFLSNIQFFTSTDIIQLKIAELNTIVYFNQSSITNYGNIIGLDLNKTIQVGIPIIRPGIYSLIISFFSSNYRAIQFTKQITIASSTIGVSLTNSSIDRLNIAEQPKDFVTYNFNFDITGLKYNYFISNNQSVVYSSTGIVSNVVLKLPINIAFYYPLGDYYLNLELLKNNIIHYTKLVHIIVYDYIETNLQFNNDSTDNQLSINFALTTFIEDTLVVYPTTVAIYNNDTNQILKNIQVSSTKYFTLSFSNKTDLPKLLKVETKTNNSLYHTEIAYYPVYYRDQTSITTNYNQSINVERLEQVSLRINVTTKAGILVQTGLVDVSIDSSKQSEINLNQTNLISYVVPADFQVGKHTLTINYLGTDNLRPSLITYDYYVYSNVHFDQVTVNNTFTNQNKQILVKGYVLDENNTGIITKISIIDSNNNIIGQTISSSDGNFSFIIINSNVMGYYNYKLQAETVSFY